MTETETQFIREFFKGVVGGWTGEGWTPYPIQEINFQDQGNYTLVELAYNKGEHTAEYTNLYFPAAWTIPQVPASVSSETVPALTPQQISQVNVASARLTLNLTTLAFALQGADVTSSPTLRLIAAIVGDVASLYSLVLPYSAQSGQTGGDQGSQDAPPG